jgi:hypothetical protein
MTRKVPGIKSMAFLSLILPAGSIHIYRGAAGIYGAKNATFCAICLYKTPDHFTKTGSGQT